MTTLGIEALLSNSTLLARLQGKRVALLGHPASTTKHLEHSLYALAKQKNINLSCAFGPQHGMMGDKQDNMIETDDYKDPKLGIPVFSLYGTTRRLTDKMLTSFDVLLVDLQDIGCRIYTYVTTLRYVLEAGAQKKKEIWVLDRPNPIGRPVEGSFIDLKKFESFVGATRVPMRHGLTMGELALWIKHEFKLDVELNVVKMEDFSPTAAPDFGWSQKDLPWINPSPNIPALSSTRVFPGGVLLEGTLLSEGRGTTRPFEIVGGANLKSEAVLKLMSERAPQWMKGCKIRPCYFEPTFHKFQGKLCSGIQVHVDNPYYKHEEFKPYRLYLLLLKCFHELHPEFDLWRKPPYEYESVRLPIDLLTGSTFAREWVDNKNATPNDLEKVLAADEKEWLDQRRPYLLYS